MQKFRTESPPHPRLKRSCSLGAERLWIAWLGRVPAVIPLTWVLLTSVLLIWAASSASAQDVGAQAAGPHQLCENAIVLAGKEVKLPAHLALSIARVESGRQDLATGRVRPWPWTINSDGLGSYYTTREDAVAAAIELRSRGIRSIDVGCMQVNLWHHPRAFADLDEAFDPLANARYAVRFLMALHRQTGDWVKATAAYHSQTRDLGEEYARKVLGPGALVKAISTPLQRPDAALLSNTPPTPITQHPVRPPLTVSELETMEKGVPGLACPINRC